MTTHHKRLPSIRGFTLIELLVVIAIIALLVSILLPSLRKAKEIAKEIVCLSGMRSTYLTMSVYASDNEGVAPFHDSQNTWVGAFQGISQYAYRAYDCMPNHPEQIDTEFFVDALEPFGMDIKTMDCPSSKRVPKDSGYSQGGKIVWYSTDWVFLPGMDEVSKFYSGTTWFDSTPTAASFNMLDDPSKIVIADFTEFALNGYGYINHGTNGSRGPEEGNNIMTYNQFYDELKGGNRVSADGAGQWVTPDQMGTDFGPMDSVDPFSGHYDRMATSRTYYW